MLFACPVEDCNEKYKVEGYLSSHLHNKHSVPELSDAVLKLMQEVRNFKNQIVAGQFDDLSAPLVKQSTSSSTLLQSTSAGNLNTVAAALLLQQQQRQKQQAAQQPSTSSQANKTQSQSKGTKRKASNAASTSTNAASNNATQNMFMDILRTNPLMSAMMGSNPPMFPWMGNANDASANRSSSNARDSVGSSALLPGGAAPDIPSAANTNNQNLLNLFNDPLGALMAQDPLLQNLQRLHHQQASSSSSKSTKKS